MCDSVSALMKRFPGQRTLKSNELSSFIDPSVSLLFGYPSLGLLTCLFIPPLSLRSISPPRPLHLAIDPLSPSLLVCPSPPSVIRPLTTVEPFWPLVLNTALFMGVCSCWSLWWGFNRRHSPTAASRGVRACSCLCVCV